MTSAVATQTRNLPLLVTPSLAAGRTYIVTGANTGLGFEASKHLATLGAGKVILAVRNPAAGDLAKQEIDTAAGTAGTSVVEVWPLDMASYDSVRAFVRRVDAELERVDAVVLNAAVAQAKREMAEGHLLSVTVNVLSTILLATLLLPVVKRKAAEGTMPRLVMVASRAGFDSKEDWEGIKGDFVKGMDAEEFPATKSWVLSFPFCPFPLSILCCPQLTCRNSNRYGPTKLAETLAVRHLARELVPADKTGVIINLVCPGLCVTNLARNAPQDFTEKLREMHANFGRTAEDGSRTLLHGVVAGVESHGKLLHSCEDGEYVSPSDLALV